MSHSSNHQSNYIETPRGIFTSAGNWFHITKDRLEAFAPGLLKKHSLGKLINQSEIWIRSADSLGIILFMLLLYVSDSWTAALSTVLFVTVWHIYKSSAVTISLTHFLRFADKEFFLVLLSVFILSWMGISGHYISVFIGILFFCILKFGWLRLLVDRLYTLFKKESIMLNDRLLKMLILKYAIKEDIPVKEIEKMEKEIMTLINKQDEVIKKFKKKK